MRAASAGEQCLQCHCSNSSQTLGSSPSLLPGIFLLWECGVCAAPFFPTKQRENLSLRNKYFRALWCNKAWVLGSGRGEEQSVLCVGKEGNSRYRDLNMKIAPFSTNLLDVVGFCGDLFPSAGRCWCCMKLFHVTEMPCEKHEAAEILCAVAMKETRGFTGFYWFESLKDPSVKVSSLSRTKISGKQSQGCD